LRTIELLGLWGLVFALVGSTASEAAKGKESKKKNPAQVSASDAPELLPVPPPNPAVRSLNPSLNPYGLDAVGMLIQRVEATYETAVANYRAGKAEQAKEEFDRALSLLMQSGLDIQGDDRLSAEFNRLVENISGVELAAIERGDVLSEHRYEPPPVESLADLTFPTDPRIKQQVQQEIQSVHSDLPLVSNDLVDGVISYLQTHARGYVERVLKGLGTYGPMISQTLSEEGLPQDLIYLAAGESAFNPFALSNKGAKGMWQFVVGTGSLYGLKKDAWVDEREDPVKSTRAAARHLRDLHQTFGDWFLAMAAYDSGPMTVQRAVERTGYADYWELRRLHALPHETENYVPIFLATALIAKDPKAYGFDVAPDPTFKVDQVTVKEPTDLRLVAQLIDRPTEELVRLNPSLQRWTTPANQSEFELNLPPGTKDAYEKAIATIPPGQRVWWRAHKLEEGETLATVARKYRISATALAEANQLQLNAPVTQGTRLVLPLAPPREGSFAKNREQGTRRTLHYRVQRGDTLELVADRFEVTPYQVRVWNGLRSSQLVAGRTLIVYPPGATRASSHPRGAKSGPSTPRPPKRSLKGTTVTSKASAASMSVRSPSAR
jgi:membrane-bound lytic murein transglycosylase D